MIKNVIVSSRRSKEWRTGFSAVIIYSLILSVCAAVLISGSGCGKAEPKPEGNLLITEIMPNNTTTLECSSGTFYDWIELYNNTSAPLNLKGYYLSDSSKQPYKWAFPEMTLDAGEYIIVYASGGEGADTSMEYCHASFRLSSKGEEVVLTNAKDMYSSVVTFGPSLPNVSYGLVMEDDQALYKWFDNPTPGAANSGNTADSAMRLPSTSITGVVINEYMTANTYTLYDSEGDYCDWVELYNKTNDDIDLSDCALSDIETDTDMWIFPSGTVIGGGEYMLVYLSDKDKSIDGELHANFRLSENDSVIMLFDKGSRMIDMADIVMLQDDVSYGRAGDEWRYYTLPSPGRENTGGMPSLTAALSLEGRLYISEVYAAGFKNNAGDERDWVELYNDSGADINLAGYGLAKTIDTFGDFSFGDTVIPAGGSLVVYTVGAAAAHAALETPFKLDSSGDVIYLTDPYNRVIDSFSTGKLRQGISSGRAAPSKSERVFYSQPTPGERNSSGGCTGYAATPRIVTDGLYLPAGGTVTIDVPKNTTVRYTTDGSQPDGNSAVYTEPIVVNSSLTVKAVSFAEGKLPSDCDSATVILEDAHTLPVVCIGVDKNAFFGENGIYNTHGISSYGNDSFEPECKCSVEYYENGQKQLAFSAGIRLHGSGSRTYPQKAMAIMLRDTYGASSVTFPFFEGCDRVTAKSLVLRAGGQDQHTARIRDAYCCRVVSHHSDNLLASESRAVVVYINGEYWGLYELREKINEDYLEIYEGIDKNNVDMILHNGVLCAGSFDEYRKLLTYMQENDLNNSACFKYVSEQIDLASSIDYVVFQTLFKNIDYGNMRVYRDRSGGKWRWIFFDLDMSMANNSASSNTTTFEEIINEDALIRQLLTCDEYVDMLLARYSELLCGQLTSDSLLQIFDKMTGEIEPEIAQNYERWSTMSTLTTWKHHVQTLRQRLENRPRLLSEEVKKYFGLSNGRYNELFGDVFPLEY